MTKMQALVDHADKIQVNNVVLVVLAPNKVCDNCRNLRWIKNMYSVLPTCSGCGNQIKEVRDEDDILRVI